MSDKPTEEKASAKPKRSLDELLSLKPVLSDEVVVAHGGQTLRVQFREVADNQRNECLMSAIQHVEERRRKREKGDGKDPDSKGEWRNAEMNLDTLKCSEQELRVLASALIDPKTGGPAVSLDVLRKRAGTNMLDELGQKYAEFENGVSPQNVTEEMVKHLIADVKKNTNLPLLWTLYGSLTALKCVQCLVLHPEKYLTELSSGTSTGDTPLSPPPKSEA